MKSDSYQAALPSRLYFVTDQSEPTEKNIPSELEQEEVPLAGAETTGARLEDLFQSGNESNTSTAQETQTQEELEEISSGFISRLLENRSNKSTQENEIKQKSGFRVRRVRRLVRQIGRAHV